MHFRNLKNKHGFKVISVDVDIFIFVGDPATGKSHFGRLISNAIMVDDVSTSDNFIDIQNRVETFKIGSVPKPGSILIFITNDERNLDTLKKLIKNALVHIRKYGRVIYDEE